VYPAGASDLVQLETQEDRRVSSNYDVSMGNLYVGLLVGPNNKIKIVLVLMFVSRAGSVPMGAYLILQVRS
jgi:hypothetical protein